MKKFLTLLTAALLLVTLGSYGQDANRNRVPTSPDDRVPFTYAPSKEEPSAPSDAATLGFTYVGSFNGSDGENWNSNPPCYSGQEAAALLFGGTPEEYAISVNPNTTDPGTITFTAWCCSWGEGWGIYPQDFMIDAGDPGYNVPIGGPAVSAYVGDWWGDTMINYVWRVDNPVVPVSNWAIGIGIILMLTLSFITIRRRF